MICASACCLNCRDYKFVAAVGVVEWADKHKNESDDSENIFQLHADLSGRGDDVH